MKWNISSGFNCSEQRIKVIASSRLKLLIPLSSISLQVSLVQRVSFGFTLRNKSGKKPTKARIAQITKTQKDSHAALKMCQWEKSRKAIFLILDFWLFERSINLISPPRLKYWFVFDFLFSQTFKVGSSKMRENQEKRETLWFQVPKVCIEWWWGFVSITPLLLQIICCTAQKSCREGLLRIRKNHQFT